MKVCLVLFVVAVVACTSAAEVQQKTSLSGAEGQNHDNKGEKANEQKQEVSSGKSSKHDQDSVKKGQEFEELHKKTHLEKKGKKSSHHQEDSHKSSKNAAGGSQHGLKYADAKKNKKANYLKGFREKFQKDEEKKHDIFFSNGEKSGEYEVYGKKNSKQSLDSYSKKNKKNHKNTGSGRSTGKSFKSAKGHHDSANKAHKSKGGSESHHKTEEKIGKKRGVHGGKKYKALKL